MEKPPICKKRGKGSAIWRKHLIINSVLCSDLKIWAKSQYLRPCPRQRYALLPFTPYLRAALVTGQRR